MSEPKKESNPLDFSFEPLTEKQQRFVEHYVECWNGSEAARRAGYGKPGKPSFAVQLLSNPRIKAAIERARQHIAETAHLNAVRIVQALERIAYADPRTLFAEDGTLRHPKELPEHVALAITSIEVEEEEIWKTVKKTRKRIGTLRTTKVRFNDRLTALDRLARYTGLMPARKVNVTVDGKVGHGHVHVHAKPQPKLSDILNHAPPEMRDAFVEILRKLRDGELTTEEPKQLPSPVVTTEAPADGQV